MPTTQIHCLGLSHRTTPVELRELFSSPLIEPEAILFPEEHRSRQEANDPSTAGCPFHGRTSGEILRSRRNGNGKRPHKEYLRNGNGTYRAIREVSIFATCNRMEMYACVDSGLQDAKELLTRFLGEVYDTDPKRIEPHLYHFHGTEAVAHLCKVSSGLDSQVLGETQILGQVTGAYENALESLTAGPFLLTLFKSAIRAGKRSRTETDISRNPASMSSVAIATAQDVVGDLHDRSVLVVGMGEMGLLTLRALHARQLKRVAVANRSLDRARALAEHWGIPTFSLDQLALAMEAADVVITSTGAPGAIIDKKTVETVMENRKDRPLVLVDIAVPRDVDAGVADIEGVHLFDADDLKVSLDRAREARKREIPRVEKIISEETAHCEIEMRQMSMKPVITDLREKAETIRRGEIERALRHLPDVDSSTVEHIQQMSRAIVNKLLHEPTVQLKRSAENGLHDQYSSTVRHLFGLPDSTES